MIADIGEIRGDKGRWRRRVRPFRRYQPPPGSQPERKGEEWGGGQGRAGEGQCPCTTRGQKGQVGVSGACRRPTDARTRGYVIRVRSYETDSNVNLPFLSIEL